MSRTIYIRDESVLHMSHYSYGEKVANAVGGDKAAGPANDTPATADVERPTK